MPDCTHVLLAEDDLNLGQVLSEYLTLKGFNVSLHRDGLAAWDGYVHQPPDLCILDVMMPLEDGFSLARRIREVDTQVPIIFLTAKNMQQDRIEGFMIGGDDYLTKPFSMQELMLRMQAIMRRVQGHSEPQVSAEGIMRIGKIEFDPATRTLTAEEDTRVLTNKEARLLQMLASQKNQTLKRADALKKIWGEDSYYNARSMDVYLTKLRKLIKPEYGVQILTVHGEGFKLIELDRQK